MSKLMKKVKMKDKGKIIEILNLTNEFIEKNGKITAEFSTNNLSSNCIRVIDIMNKKLKKCGFKNRWKIYFCEVCFDRIHYIYKQI